MVSGNGENKRAFENGIFLKVDSVEPVYKTSFIVSSLSDYSCIDGVKAWIGGDGHFFPCDSYTVCDPDAAREDGHRQVVALAKELTDMKIADKDKLFGYHTVTEIITQFSYDEVAKKLDSWKKEKETIRVRDEVYSEPYDWRFVITKIYVPSGGEEAIVNGLKKDGSAVKGLLLCNLKKTGLHVDDLDAYLEV